MPTLDADNCHAYESEWKLVPHPDQTLPDLVVTTRGTRLEGEPSNEFLTKEKDGTE